jgi:hypothetical protein
MPATPKTAPELLLTLFTGTYAQCDLDHRGWLDIRAKRGDTRTVYGVPLKHLLYAVLGEASDANAGAGMNASL